MSSIWCTDLAQREHTKPTSRPTVKISLSVKRVGASTKEICSHMVQTEAHWNNAEQLPNLFFELGLHRFATFPQDFDKPKRVSRRELVQSGFFFNKEQKPQCHYCNFVIHDVGNWKIRIDQKHLENSINCPLMTDKVIDYPLTSIHNNTYEAWRLYSFFNFKWPNKNVSPFDLAHQGFYFTGDGDNCVCHFCKLEVKFWEKGDTAISEHLRWNPKCPFLNNLVRNVDIGKECEKPIRNFRDVTEELLKERLTKIGVKNARRNLAVKSEPLRINETNLGILSVHSSTHPEMQDFKSRRRSFLSQNWPKQKENLIPQLCQAGFYYTGRSDVCKCHHCGVSIKDWELDDCPWTEHGRFKTNCAYFSLFNAKLDDDANMLCVDERNGAHLKNHRNCKDCCQNEANTACLPCGHVSLCEECADKHPLCPICGSVYYFRIKIYIS